MTEWMIVKNRDCIVKRGIKTFKEAMKELQALVDHDVVTIYNPKDKDKNRYEHISDVKLPSDYILIKATKVINYDIKCDLKMKATPKELADMVQAPKNGGQ